MKLDTSFLKKNKKLLPFLVGGGVLLLGVIGFVLYWYVLGDVKPSYVRVTNQTDTSFTVSWITSKKSKGQVLVREEDKFLPGVLAPIGSDKYYDDRDVVKAELEAGEKRTEKAAKEVEGSDDKVIDINNYNFDVEVKKQGRYYVHTVTISNLKADTGYYFRIGNGFRWYGDSLLKDNPDDGYDFGAMGINKMRAETLVLPEDQGFVDPNPSYGSVELGSEIEAENILIFSFFGDTGTAPRWENLSMPLSGSLNEDMGWYIDQANARFESGYNWGSNDPEKVYQIVQLMYVLNGEIYQTEVMSFFDYEMRPAGTIVVDGSDETVESSNWAFSAYASKGKTETAMGKGVFQTSMAPAKTVTPTPKVEVNAHQEAANTPVADLKATEQTAKSTTTPQVTESQPVEQPNEGSKRNVAQQSVATTTNNKAISAPVAPVVAQTETPEFPNMINCEESPYENPWPHASNPGDICPSIDRCPCTCPTSPTGLVGAGATCPLTLETFAECVDGSCIIGAEYGDGTTCALERGQKICVTTGGTGGTGTGGGKGGGGEPVTPPEPVDPCNGICLPGTVCQVSSKGHQPVTVGPIPIGYLDLSAVGGVCVPEFNIPDPDPALTIEQKCAFNTRLEDKLDCEMNVELEIFNGACELAFDFGGDITQMVVGQILTAGNYGLVRGAYNAAICAGKNALIQTVPVLGNFIGNSGGFIPTTYAATEGSYLVINDVGLYNMVLGGEVTVDVNANFSGYRVGFFIDNNGNGIPDEGDEWVDASALQIELKKESEVFNYQLSEGYNFVSFPFVGDDSNNLTTMSAVLKHLNSKGIEATVMATYDNGWKAVDYRTIMNEDFDVEGRLYGANDFPINPGRGYVIRVINGGGNVTLSGYKVAQPVPVEIKDAWNLIGVHGLKSYDGYTADNLIESMVDQGIPAEIATQWIRGRYESRIIKDVEGTVRKFGNDFPIEEYKAYFIRVEGGSGIWEPDKE